MFSGFLTVPVGLTQGLAFAEDGFTPISSTTKPQQEQDETQHEFLPEVKLGEEKNVVNLMNLLNQENDVLGLWKEQENEPKAKSHKAPAIELRIHQLEEDETIIPKVSIKVSEPETDLSPYHFRLQRNVKKV